MFPYKMVVMDIVTFFFLIKYRDMLSSKPKASCMQLIGFLMVTNTTLFPFMKELTDTGAEKYLEVQLSSMR